MFKVTRNTAPLTTDILDLDGGDTGCECNFWVDSAMRGGIFA